jgi:hypothetical protein
MVDIVPRVLRFASLSGKRQDHVIRGHRAGARGRIGLQSKREAVEAGLRLLVQLKEQAGIRAARGKLPWDGDLDAMRRDDA